MKLVLARHGQTDWNVQKKFYGLSNIPLNDTGKKQAEHLSEGLKKNRLNFDIGYCSELMRTYQTIEPCLKKNTPIIKLSGLNEKGFGKWEGLDADQIEAQYPKEWQNWLDQPFDYLPPDAEDFYDFSDHVKKSIDQVINNTIKNNYQNVILVSHLGSLRVIDQYLLNDEYGFWDIHFDAGCYTVLEFDQDRNFKLIERNIG